MLFFIVIVFLSGCNGSLIDTFLNVHLNNQGAPGVLMGTARMLTCAAEVPFFRVSGKILKKLGVSGAKTPVLSYIFLNAKSDRITKTGSGQT